MDELEPIDLPARLAQSREGAKSGSGRQTVPAGGELGATSKAAPQVVTFDRRELNAILGMYGRKVAEGEWRDYAIDFTSQRAVFSIFRRSSEVPLFRIEKDPRLARRQGMYSVIASTGLILRRGADLARVISVLDKRLKLVKG